MLHFFYLFEYIWSFDYRMNQELPFIFIALFFEPYNGFNGPGRVKGACPDKC